MLRSNQQAHSQVWPFLRAEPPVNVDWLPWSHTFGGNHNLGQVLAFGGTMYIDDGRPTPALFERTVAALRDVPPTVYYNVPAGPCSPGGWRPTASSRRRSSRACASCSTPRPRCPRGCGTACAPWPTRSPTTRCR
jgi:hypothetical protein